MKIAACMRKVRESCGNPCPARFRAVTPTVTRPTSVAVAPVGVWSGELRRLAAPTAGSVAGATTLVAGCTKWSCDEPDPTTTPRSMTVGDCGELTPTRSTGNGALLASVAPSPSAIVAAAITSSRSATVVTANVNCKRPMVPTAHELTRPRQQWGQRGHDHPARVGVRAHQRNRGKRVPGTGYRSM
jgi:hypothetical protein